MSWPPSGNLVISILRLAGHTSIAQALRHTARNPNARSACSQTQITVSNATKQWPWRVLPDRSITQRDAVDRRGPCRLRYIRSERFAARAPSVAGRRACRSSVAVARRLHRDRSDALHAADEEVYCLREFMYKYADARPAVIPAATIASPGNDGGSRSGSALDPPLGMSRGSVASLIRPYRLGILFATSRWRDDRWSPSWRPR